MQPTKDTYDQLDEAYQYFNDALFARKLPPCVLVLQRKRKAYGYFWGDTWSDREGRCVTDEIALNPDMFEARSVEEILSTLVHEMCHLQQHHFGKSSKEGYHNREWADMMEKVGLIPTDTGQRGGKRTGRKVSHVIEAGGRFDVACAKFLADGFTIPWQALTPAEEERAKKKVASKTKYTCASCGANAWAKPETRLVCGLCMEVMLPEESEPEEAEEEILYRTIQN